VTVEEVITHFSPEDFKPRSWEHKEASEVVVRSTVEEVAEKSAIEVLKDTTLRTEVKQLVEGELK
ncbi:jg3215, partial [Pararge aegeria aegeria]